MEGTDWNSGGVVQEIILNFRCWNVGVWVVVGLCPTSLVWPMFDIYLPVFGELEAGLDRKMLRNAGPMVWLLRPGHNKYSINIE